MSCSKHEVLLGSCGHVISQCRCIDGGQSTRQLSFPCEACRSYEILKVAFVGDAKVQVREELGFGIADQINGVTDGVWRSQAPRLMDEATALIRGGLHMKDLELIVQAGHSEIHVVAKPQFSFKEDHHVGIS